MNAMNLSAGRTMAGSDNYLAELENTWKQKELHGRFAAALYNKTVDTQLSTAYLKQGQLMVETEGFIRAIQLAKREGGSMGTGSLLDLTNLS
ncbi:hypothetical protein HHI36_007656 [Cryptolaemus montrouzieri]|uniref:Uncharacterized protein n=1 Tax=Cryptolaemus montrouzieri TaxID=559131 RepID=A0ABD2MQ68_9CUCU